MNQRIVTFHGCQICEAQEQTQSGGLASVTGFDQGRWSLVRFSPWREQPAEHLPGQEYHVGHVSI
jgi:hypothetical protein